MQQLNSTKNHLYLLASYTVTHLEMQFKNSGRVYAVANDYIRIRPRLLTPVKSYQTIQLVGNQVVGSPNSYQALDNYHEIIVLLQ